MEGPVHPSPPDAASPTPELVVVNGRLSGVRRPLTGPLTLFGQAPQCDIRLNIEGVQPLHAALVQGPDGFLLRDLAGAGDVLVNDRPAALAPLQPGDEIIIGPFRFRLEAAAASRLQAVEAERDALRIQAAAVVAQQTALNEEEMRLQQRRGALEEQEGQLAARLEERRGRLLELQEQTRKERETFKAERAAAKAEQTATRKELQAEREAGEALGKKAREERRRLVELRKRLRRRWRRHFNEKEAALARLEKELSVCAGSMEREAARLERARTDLAQERLRLNGDVELGRRRLRDQGQELALAQQQWEACLNQDHAERTQRIRELDARAAALEEAEHVWAGRERSVRLSLTALHRESAGLETRIHSQREKLAEEETAVARRQAERGAELPALTFPPMPSAEAAPAAGDARTASLEEVADRLVDQRAHLLEQWQTLLRVQEEWRRDREQALSELETAGRSLQEREQRLVAQERRLGAATADLRQKQQSLSQMRYSLEGRQARLKVRDLAWEAERKAQLAGIQGREETVGLAVRRLHELAQQREQQRREEAEELAAARTECEDLRRQYASLWSECQQRRAELAREQRDLAARMLAAEQTRLEIVGKAAHSARAERRMERLRRRNLARIQAAEREIDAARKCLAAEGARLDELARGLGRRQREFSAGQEARKQEQTAWEERQIAADDAEQRRRLEQRVLLAQRQQNEHVIAQMRDEMEKVAALLLEQADIPKAQAA